MVETVISTQLLYLLPSPFPRFNSFDRVLHLYANNNYSQGFSVKIFSLCMSYPSYFFLSFFIALPPETNSPTSTTAGITIGSTHFNTDHFPLESSVSSEQTETTLSSVPTNTTRITSNSFHWTSTSPSVTIQAVTRHLHQKSQITTVVYPRALWASPQMVGVTLLSVTIVIIILIALIISATMVTAMLLWIRKQILKSSKVPNISTRSNNAYCIPSAVGWIEGYSTIGVQATTGVGTTPNSEMRPQQGYGNICMHGCW